MAYLNIRRARRVTALMLLSSVLLGAAPGAYAQLGMDSAQLDTSIQEGLPNPDLTQDNISVPIQESTLSAEESTPDEKGTPDTDNVDQLIKNLGDDDYQTREKAEADLINFYYLNKLKPAQIEKIRDALINSPDPEVRQRARRILAAGANRSKPIQEILNSVRVYASETVIKLPFIGVVIPGKTVQFGNTIKSIVLLAPANPAVKKLVEAYAVVNNSIFGGNLTETKKALENLKKAIDDLTKEEFESLKFKIAKDPTKPFNNANSRDATKEDVIKQIDKAIAQVDSIGIGFAPGTKPAPAPGVEPATAKPAPAPGVEAGTAKPAPAPGVEAGTEKPAPGLVEPILGPVQ
jgi:hypothetical protein